MIRSKPSSRGYSCASCETYIGDLKNDNNRYIHWNKLPERDYKGENFFKVQNGYSRLLQMINFDSNGKMTLNPFANNDNSSNISNKIKSTSTRSNDLNRSLSRGRSVYSVRTKREYSIEKTKTIDTMKSENEDKYSDQNLPIIKASSSVDNSEKIIEKKDENV